jgi:hypothetical protein
MTLTEQDTISVYKRKDDRIPAAANGPTEKKSQQVC